jgi:iron(III) transport system substrate-binding protein
VRAFVKPPIGETLATRTFKKLISPLLETDEGNEGEALSSTALRPISLSPALMVALDALTRETFLRRWRATFPGP